MKWTKGLKTWQDWWYFTSGVLLLVPIGLSFYQSHLEATGKALYAATVVWDWMILSTGIAFVNATLAFIFMTKSKRKRHEKDNRMDNGSNSGDG